MVKNVNRTARLQWKVDTIKNCIYLKCRWLTWQWVLFNSSGLLTPLASLGVRLQWFERDLSHSSHSCMNSYKNYNTSNLLFIFQIIWFLTYAWFLFQACDVRGSANTTTTVDSNSGSLKNETCKCKNFVKGEFCNECKEGYWNLTQINPDGCQSK